MEAAAFSFKNLSRISNLWGLDKLCKLQLDNNRIEKIENLGHLVSSAYLRLGPISLLLVGTQQQDLGRHLDPCKQHGSRSSRACVANIPTMVFAASLTVAEEGWRDVPGIYTACTLLLQTNLTWLDLSFNRITAIEGLEQLTKLQDLSLFNNQISSLQGLDTLQNLNVLSIG